MTKNVARLKLKNAIYAWQSANIGADALRAWDKVEEKIDELLQETVLEEKKARLGMAIPSKKEGR